MKQPKAPIFFIDRSLGAHKLSVILKGAGCEIRVHDDFFEQTTKDVDWIKAVGEVGWAFLTKDNAINRNELERKALVEAKVHAFMLGNAQLGAEDMAKAFLVAMPRMTKVINRYEPTTVATVTRDGSVNLRYADGQWFAKPRAVK